MPDIADTIKNQIKRSDGILLKQSLGLDKFKYIWVQKIINHPNQIFIVTIDSRYPNTYLSMQKVKNAKGAIVTSARRSGNEVITKDFKLTPPLELETARIDLASNCVIFLRDLAGDYWRDPSMFESIQKNVEFKIIEVRE